MWVRNVGIKSSCDVTRAGSASLNYVQAEEEEDGNEDGSFTQRIAEIPYPATPPER